MFLLRWAILAAILAIIAAILGFGGLASDFAAVARVLFFIFLAAVVVLIVLGFAVFRRISGPPNLP